MAEQKRLPFQGSEEVKEDVEFNAKLKVNNDKSRFKRKAEAKVDFEKRANQLIEQKQLLKNERFKLISSFMDTMRNKTLSSNRGLIGEQYEQEVRKKFVDMIIDINNDENEQRDGMGSATAVGILLRTVMMQRDQINELDYKLNSLEKKVVDLEKNLSSQAPAKG